MAKRKSINWAGFKHENPIPNASMIGNLMMSSIMSGRDPDTGTVPPELDAQVVNISSRSSSPSKPPAARRTTS